MSLIVMASAAMQALRLSVSETARSKSPYEAGDCHSAHLNEHVINLYHHVFSELLWSLHCIGSLGSIV